MAEATGWVDVDAMLDSITPQQWAEWVAKDIIDPIGHRGTHEVLAILSAMVAQFMGSKDVTPLSVLWWRKEEEQPVSHEAAIMALQTIGAKRG